MTEREVFMGESLPRLPVQNEHSEVCTSDRGQDSPIQTDLARKEDVYYMVKQESKGTKT